MQRGKGGRRGGHFSGRYSTQPKKTSEVGDKAVQTKSSFAGYFTTRNWFRAGNKTPLHEPCEQLIRVAFPRSPFRFPSDDPRSRSRNLGWLLDGPLGWGADLLGMLPIVGPVTGALGRCVCKIVRGIEDGVNFATKWSGLTLFFLCLLHVISPASSACVVDRTESHNITRNRSLTAPSVFRRLSNCCPKSAIFHCTEYWCTHKPGCVPCSYDGNVTCWVPYSRLASHHPDHSGVDFGLGRHIEIIALGSTLCDLLDVGELCATISMVGAYVYSHIDFPGNWTCDADCYLLVPSGYDPGFMAFLRWAADQFSWLSVVLDLVSRIPAAILQTSGNTAIIISAVFSVNILGGKFVKAFCFLILYVEAVTASALPRSTDAPHHSCSAIKPALPCNNTMPWDSGTHFLLYCFDPNPVSIHRYDNGFVGIPWRTRGCVWLEKQGNETTTKCCSRRVFPCPHCGSDCSWNVTEPLQTYELCGWGPWFSTAWHLGAPAVVAVLDYPGRLYHFPETWGWFTGNVVWGSQRLRYAYNRTLTDSLPPEAWARLPGAPNVVRSRWTEVPKGMYSSLPDLATGLISKDNQYPDYQLFLTDGGFSVVLALEAWLLAVLLGAVMGGKFVPLIVAVFAVVTNVSAAAITRTVRSALVATAYDVPWIVAIVLFLLGYRYGKAMYPFLIANPPILVLLILAHQVCPAAALELAYEDLIGPIAGAVVGLCCLAILAMRYSVSFFPTRLALLWGYLNTRLYHEVHLVERYNLHFIMVATILLPAAARTVVCFLLAGCVAFNLFMLWYFDSPKVGFQFLLSITKNLSWFTPYIQSAILWLAGRWGVYFFHHLQQTANLARETLAMLASVEPAYPFRTNVKIVYERGARVACGDLRAGLPVTARLGDFLRVGIGPTPPGWLKTAPISVTTVVERRELTCAAISLTGVDQKPHQGNLFRMGSMLRQWMGFGYEGRLWTVHHGCRGRRLAAKGGPCVPISVNRDMDLVSYPLPAGSRCFEACYCSNVTAGYLVARDLLVYEFAKGEGELWTPVSHFPLNVAKGSSGTPLLCKSGHVLGVFAACQTCRGAVTKVRVKQLCTSGVVSRDVDVADPTSNPPMVPKDECRVEFLTAPTGSGKSTRLPMTYYNAGHRVLVLNPSVATTLNLGPYMKGKYGVNPNVYAGTSTFRTGSRLTYCTYGRFLAQPLPKCYDVIICDECHAVDATTILGIGRVIDCQQEMGTKLVVLTTATPPGCPVKPHENIHEIELGDEGELPFHGKKIQLSTIASGRHLIFEASKKHCDALAKELVSRGIRAVSYYRGKPVTDIPFRGDVVVVATDALMTGYTGDFDSVIDCNLMVTPTFEVDMDPTFTLGVRTVPQDSVNRIQRRGRTGRGRPGHYYYVSKEAVPSGLVPEANIIEAFDSGIAFYGLDPATISAALSVYRDEVGLGTFRMNLDFCVQLFTHINPTSGDVSMAKSNAENYVLLTAYQRGICRACKAERPSDSPRWRGLKAGQGWVNIYNLDGKSPGGLPSHPDIDLLTLMLAEVDVECGLATTLITLGAGFCAAWIALDAFGAVTIQAVYNVTCGESAAARGPGVEEFLGTLIETEECSFGALTELYATLRTRVLAAAQSAVDYIAKNPEAPATVFLRAHGPSLLSLLQYSAGLLTLDTNPVVAAAMGFFSGVLCPLPLPTKLFLAILGGAFASKIGTEKSAILFVGATCVGAMADTSGISGVVASMISGYASATSTANVVFHLLCRKLPTATDLAGLISVVTNPGGALLGALVAALCFGLTSPGANIWPNRLLAMLVRGNALPDGYFMEAENVRESLCRLFAASTPLSLLTRIVNWLNEPVLATCDRGGIRGYFIDLWHHLCRLARAAREAAAGVLTRAIARPAVPIYSCDKPYVGRWRGTGTITVRCSCGQEGTWHVSLGSARPISVSKLCRAYYVGGVPINNTFHGSPRPDVQEWDEMVVAVGYNTYIKYKNHGERVTVVATNAKCEVPAASPHVLAACAVNGIQIDPYAGDWATPWTEEVLYAGIQTQLPFDIVPPREPEEGSVAPPHTLRWAWQACGFPRGCVEQYTDWVSFMKAYHRDPDTHGGFRPKQADRCYYCYSELQGQRTDFGRGRDAFCSNICHQLSKDVNSWQHGPPTSANAALARAIETGTAQVHTTLLPPNDPPKQPITLGTSVSGFACVLDESLRHMVAPLTGSEPVPTVLLGPPTGKPTAPHGLPLPPVGFDEIDYQMSEGLRKRKDANRAASHFSFLLIEEDEDEKARKEAERRKAARERGRQLFEAKKKSIQTSLQGNLPDHQTSASSSSESCLSYVSASSCPTLGGSKPKRVRKRRAASTQSGSTVATGVSAVVTEQPVTRAQQLKASSPGPTRPVVEPEPDPQPEPDGAPIAASSSEPGAFGWVKATSREELEAALDRVAAGEPWPSQRVASPLPAGTIAQGEDLCYRALDEADSAETVQTRPSQQELSGKHVDLGAKPKDTCPPTITLWDVPTATPASSVAPAPAAQAIPAESVTPRNILFAGFDNAGFEPCATWSYSWRSVASAAKAFARRTLDPVASIANNLVRKRNLIYATDPKDIVGRAAKVTVTRDPHFGHHYLKWFQRARSRAADLRLSEMTWDEVVSVTSNKTARSRVTGLTGKQLRDGHPTGIQEVGKIVSALRSGSIPEPYNQVTIMPKSEVFVLRRKKPTPKPPRIIAYPHLEMRFAEKLILGHIAPAVAKAVLREEYGFQYNPMQRVARLVSMWKSKKRPACFACDVVCFDSTITPQDVDFERQLYRAAATEDETKLAIDTLHRELYAGGPMVSPEGEDLGVRRCRASGVFTTSTSNTLTAWMKVHAACDMAGITSPTLLVNGDDVVCVFESSSDDASKLASFAKAMMSMGAPLAEVPRPVYDLELVEACSSNVTTVRYRAGVEHILTRDPAIPFARCTAEGQGFNPEGTWIGNLVGYGRTLWARVIAVSLIETLLSMDEIPPMVEMDWYGKRWNVPLQDLPEIIQSQHGPLVWTKGEYSNREVARVSATLQELGMHKYRWYRVRARALRAEAIKRGGLHRKLATYLLSFASANPPRPLDDKSVARYSDVNFHDHYEDRSLEAEGKPSVEPNWLLITTVVSIAVLILFLTR